MNTSILDGLYKQQWAFKFSGLQIAKSLIGGEDNVPVIITEIADTEFAFLDS